MIPAGTPVPKPSPPTEDNPHPNLDAAVDALPPLTDEECAALGDLLLTIRVGRVLPGA